MDTGLPPFYNSFGSELQWRQPIALLLRSRSSVDRMNGIMTQLTSVSPISGEDPSALAVQDVNAAADFYVSVLEFSIVNQTPGAAVLERDGIRLGLVRKPDHSPEKAGSLAFSVDDLDELHRQLQAKGAKPGSF